MCTAIRFNDRFVGRTLDFERGFDEQILALPRGSVELGESHNRYAMLGMGVVRGDKPLLFDGVNEWGLVACGLNFSGYAVYRGAGEGVTVTPGGLISLVLGLCRSVAEAREMLSHIDLSNREVDGMPPAPLHWMIADVREAMVVEPLTGGTVMLDNPTGVLTNAPDLPYHLTRLSDFSVLSPRNPSESLCGGVLYSRGLGAYGLPGDFSSSSRFIRAVFMKQNAAFSGGDNDIDLAFDVMGAMGVPRGCVITEGGMPSYTRYTAVMDMRLPAYCLTTPTHRTINRIELNDSIAEGEIIKKFPV